jgi:hypothetical protein
MPPQRRRRHQRRELAVRQVPGAIGRADAEGASIACRTAHRRGCLLSGRTSPPPHPRTVSFDEGCYVRSDAATLEVRGLAERGPGDVVANVALTAALASFIVVQRAHRAALAHDFQRHARRTPAEATGEQRLVRLQHADEAGATARADGIR